MRINKSIAVLLFCSMSVTVLSAQAQLTTIFLVRHAEKDQDGTSDPGLSEQGTRRAKLLANMLESTNISSVYSTQYQRTMNTVKPLTSSLGIPIQFYGAFDENSINQIVSESVGKTILIVGHSNNIPWIANLLTGTKDYSDWKENEYSNLLILTMTGTERSAKAVNLTFGN